jgi:hypothetical protein
MHKVSMGHMCQIDAKWVAASTALHASDVDEGCKQAVITQ